MAGISTIFVSEAREELDYRQQEKEQLLNQLALYDVKLDRYDAIIENMDRSILPLIDEINVEIDKVKVAYEDRISHGCRSDLVWVVVGVSTRSMPPKFGGGAITTITYQVQKNPAVRIQYPYWGAKYYRRPKNQDYGSNIITEFFGSIGAGNTNLAIRQIGLGGTTGILPGDIITDDIDNPTIFGVDDLPTITGIGKSTVVIETRMFGGTTTIGSTFIAHTGIGSTGGISIGTTASELNNFIATPPNSIIGTSFLPQLANTDVKIVGFGTTTISDVGWSTETGSFVTDNITVPALIVSHAAISSGSTDFAIGISTEFQSFFISTSADQTTDLTNFTIIRQTQSVLDEFDATNNPIDPVTVGIMNISSAGYGHTLVRVNNLHPPGPFQWREVLGEYDPEPGCGNNFATYYFGNLQWPGLEIYDYSSLGNGGFSLVDSTFEYSTEGQIKIIQSGSGAYTPLGEGSFTQPVRSGIAYTGASSNNPSSTGCGAKDSAITAAEAARDAVIAKNQPIIDGTIAASSSLRLLRDKLESTAFAILQGRSAADAEIVRLTNMIKILEKTDFSQYEPVQSRSANKLSSNTVGIPTT